MDPALVAVALEGAVVDHQPDPASNRNILNTTKQARPKTVPTPYRASAWMSHNQVVSPSPCVPRGSALGADSMQSRIVARRHRSTGRRASDGDGGAKWWLP